MFEDTINNVLHTKEHFGNIVKDSFGASVINDVMDPLETEEQKLHHEYEIAETKMAQIKAMTVELRLIV